MNCSRIANCTGTSDCNICRMILVLMSATAAMRQVSATLLSFVYINLQNDNGYIDGRAQSESSVG